MIWAYGAGPEVCVVVTAHNYGCYLDQCIQSVINQCSAPSWCMVVVDDGSKDNTQEILEPYMADPRITQVRLDGVGLACATNRGIDVTEAPWILRLDADDWLEPEALARLYDYALASEVDMVYGDLRLVNERGQDIGILSQSADIIGSALERSPVGSGMLYRRQVWEVVGGYNQTLRYQEDFDFWLKAVEQFSHAHLTGAYYVYRQHGTSMSTNRSPRARCRAEVKRAAELRRTLSLGGQLLGVIDTVHSLIDRISPQTGLLQLGGAALLDHVYNHLSHLDNVGEIKVRTDCSEIRDWAHSRGLDILVPVTNGDWLDDVNFQYGSAGKDSTCRAIRCSPYFPLLEAYRYQEILDTLLLGNYMRVDSVVADASSVLIPADGGWIPLHGDCESSGWEYRVGKMRLTGGLSAGRISVKTGKRGCVELFWPEDQIVRDVQTLKIASDLWRN